jgi:hypothetical protein
MAEDKSEKPEDKFAYNPATGCYEGPKTEPEKPADKAEPASYSTSKTHK